MFLIVRTLLVTSSPINESPLVTACWNSPSWYIKEQASPSILISAKKTGSIDLFIFKILSNHCATSL